MKKGIILAGNMIVDQIKFIETYPQEHNLTTILEESASLGGLVNNCILDLARMDASVPLAAIGIVGEDDLGDYILEELGKYPSIDLSQVRREGITSYTDVMTTPDGGRTFFQQRGANALLAPAHFDFSKVEGDLLHVGYALLLDTLDGPDPDYPTALCRVLDKAQKAGIKTSIDVVSEESYRYAEIVAPALAYTDYCVVNEVESSRITGISLVDEKGNSIMENFPKVLERLLDLGTKEWAIIHTPKFSCGMDGATRTYLQLDSWNIPEGFRKSSVGAGDAFAATVLYGIYQEWTLEKTIDMAGAVAAYSLSGEGASDAIKPFDQLIQEMERFQ